MNRSERQHMLDGLTIKSEKRWFGPELSRKSEYICKWMEGNAR